MEIHIFNPYVVGLSPDLTAAMQIRPGDSVCFAVTRDKEMVIRSLWIGVETIFTSSMAMSYVVKSNIRINGMLGFSAKHLVYEVGLNPGAYEVMSEPEFSRQTGIDWYQVQIGLCQKRNWRAIHGCSKNITKSLENSGKDVTFEDCFS